MARCLKDVCCSYSCPIPLSQEVFVTVRVEESGYFRREGVHVHTDADISLSQAILGGVIRIQVMEIAN